MERERALPLDPSTIPPPSLPSGSRGERKRKRELHKRPPSLSGCLRGGRGKKNRASVERRCRHLLPPKAWHGGWVVWVPCFAPQRTESDYEDACRCTFWNAQYTRVQDLEYASRRDMFPVDPNIVTFRDNIIICWLSGPLLDFPPLSSSKFMSRASSVFPHGICRRPSDLGERATQRHNTCVSTFV